MPSSLYNEFTSGIGNNIKSDLFPVKVLSQLQYEYIAECPLYSTYAGVSPRNPIVIMDKEVNKSGATQWKIPRVDALDFRTGVRNHQERRGQAERPRYDSFTLNSEIVSKEIEEELYWMLDRAVPFNVNSANYVLLKNWLTHNLEYETLRKMTTGLYPNISTANCNVVGTLPSWDRSLVPIDTTRAGWHANQTFPTFLNAFTNNANTGPDNTGMSLDLILRGKMMAKVGGKDRETEARLPPSYVGAFNSLPDNEYILWCDAGTVPSLMKDPEVKDGGLNRGVIIDTKYQPNITRRGDYIGKFGSVHVVVLDMLSEFRLKSADGNKTIAWNLLVGGGAFASGWDGETMLEQEISKRYLEKATFIHDPRATDTQVFDSRYARTAGAVAGTPLKVENSIIHIFTSVNY